jgi:putative ABC transport system permease protein
MEFMWRDFRSGIRAVLKNRRFAIAFLIPLAAGIGLTTAVFSFTDAVLLRPFPYATPDRIVLIWGTKSVDVRRGISGEEIENWRKQNTAFEDISAFQINPLPFSDGDDPTRTVQGAVIGTNAFSVLGVRPLLGRTFSEQENDGGGERHVLLSYGLWQSRFGGDASIVGKFIHLNGELYDVVGVMPASFFFPDEFIQLWVPLNRSSPAFGQVQAVARLRSGTTVSAAQAELDAIGLRIGRRSSVATGEIQPGVFSLYRIVVGDYQAALWTLLAAVSLLLLLACANASNLLLVRGFAREKEFAIRVALGSPPSKILRLLLLEAFILSLVAGALGVASAHYLLVFMRTLDVAQIPRFGRAHIDSRVLLFALGISLASAVISGILPARRSAHPNLNAVLQLGGVSTPPRSQGQMRELLVAVEVALAVMLMVGAGLLVNSFLRLTRAKWGFEPDHVLLVETEFPSHAQATSEQRTETLDEIGARLSKLPIVRSSAVAFGIPVRYYWQPTHLAVDGRFVTTDWVAGTWTVGSGYFETMGIRLLRGREFGQHDNRLSKRVIVLSRDLAERLWPGQSPIGKLIQILKLKAEILDRFRTNHTVLADLDTWKSEKSWEADGAPWEVVGEVENVRMFGLDADTDTYAPLYMNYAQANGQTPPSYKVLVRTSIEPLQAVSAIRDQISDVDPQSKITYVNTMSSIVSQSIGGRSSKELMLVISLLFGTLSWFLAIAGIYGVVSFVTAQRTREIGIRRTLGGQTLQIFRMLLFDGMRPVLGGLALGLVGAFAITRLLSELLFGISPTDPATFVGMSILLLIAGLLACTVPAIRAVQMDPSETLRNS